MTGPLFGLLRRRRYGCSITMVLPFPAGGSADVAGRASGRRNGQARLGQPMVVENRAGASGIVARAMSPRRLPMATP
ncbi:hypothetical protein ACTMU2_18970 [Cupriavidus basilensis]